jgi:hypothetical protein
MNLNINTATAGLRIIAEEPVLDAARKMGIDDDLLKKFCGPAPWKHGDRHKYVEIMKTLCHGTLQLQGLDIFPIGAEYFAAMIFCFVSKHNWMVACKWGADYTNTQNLADLTDTRRKPVDMERCKPEKIFGLLNLMLANEQSCAIARAFSRKATIPLEFKNEIRKEQN